MIVIVMRDRFHYRSYNYSDGTDGVVIINYEVGAAPVFVAGDMQDIDEMDDSDLATLNKSEEFVNEFGKLMRMGVKL